MIVANIHKCFPGDSLVCSVGVASDRTLLLGNVREDYVDVVDLVGVSPEEATETADRESIDVISLSQLCGKKAVVSFSYEWQPFS